MLKIYTDNTLHDHMSSPSLLMQPHSCMDWWTDILMTGRNTLAKK